MEKGHSNGEKEKIRRRYAGTDGITVIPAKPQPKLSDESRQLRVAVYARVSTGDPRQTSSYELQKNHYQDLVDRHPGWTLAGIYADEGISGTSLQHRDEFVRMIKDCHEHKIDLIITKSVSRFARNVLDCIGHARELASLEPPVGILFETENIYTLDSKSEMGLSFVSTLAQEESHNKSEVMNASIEMRFRRGIFLTPPLLGYDVDEEGRLVINENEAKTVKLIFYMYLYGYSTAQIADALVQLGRPTKKGRVSWSPAAVLSVLQNERHCGAVLARKTWTPNYLDHKSRKNKQDRNQYYKDGHHEAIISRDDFIAVSRLIRNAKYGNKGFLPELQAVSQGPLKGFIIIHPKWAGFSAENYWLASETVEPRNETVEKDEITVEAQGGDFDYRGYEVARSQFFDVSMKMCVTFSVRELLFSAGCLRKYPDCFMVELLFHPYKRLFAVRESTEGSKRAVKWAKAVHGHTVGKTVSGRAFLPVIYKIMGWDPTYKYRVRGTRTHLGGSGAILFDMAEPEIFLPKDKLCDHIAPEIATISAVASKVTAFPEDWAPGFGTDYYLHREKRSLTIFGLRDGENVPYDEMSFPEDDTLLKTDYENLHSKINELITVMRQEREIKNG